MNLTVMLALLAVAILLVTIVMGQRSASKSSSERNGLSAFKSANAPRGYPDALIEGAYHYLAERAPAPGPHYAVAGSDNLQVTYGLADLDLEDAVLVIADKAGAKLPNAHELDALKTQVRTVDDMLRFLHPYFQAQRV
ncbi:MAG: hypothetical protein H7Z40_12635 [Phycisphaerae bacterium]|nr:hypothetical protein [Gemmatimonadaceae bacterium]